MAVVGGAMAGLTCARALVRHGIEVVVFDKARRPGGRMSTRRVDDGRGRELTFDHGAQYFTARGAAFERQVESLLDAGVVARWDGRLVSWRDGVPTAVSDGTVRYVGVPTMSAMIRQLADGLEVRLGCRIDRATRRGRAWWLTVAEGTDDQGPFDGLVVALPAAQTATLLEGISALADQAAAASMTPCWAAMVVADAPPRFDYDGAFVDGEALGWVMRQASKPGRRRDVDAYVLHAPGAWTQTHWDDSPVEVGAALIAAWAERAGGPDPAQVRVLATHRWRYALAGPHEGEQTLVEPQTGLVVAGDWLGGGRVEGAYDSGRAAAERMLASISMRAGSMRAGSMRAGS